MLPLFVPEKFAPDKLVRALIGVALFASAYMAEVVRAGLAAVPSRPISGGPGAWARLLADDGSCRSAAGVACHLAEYCQYLYRPVQGYDAGFCRWHFRFSRAPSKRRGAIRNGRRRISRSRATFSPPYSILFAAMPCRVMRAASKRGWLPVALRILEKTLHEHWPRTKWPSRSRPSQMVRGLPCAARYRSYRAARRADRDLRAFRQRQIDAAPLHQPA